MYFVHGRARTGFCLLAVRGDAATAKPLGMRAGSVGPSAPCFSSHNMMSEKTISMLSSGSPAVRACHIPGYSFMVLSALLARSNSALLTSGSVTVSASPCSTKNGSVTYQNKGQLA